MEIKIRNKKENVLLKREEIVADIENKGATPDRKTVTSELAKALATTEDLVIVDKIFTERGKSDSSVNALIYKKKEDIPKYKIAKMEKRIGTKKAPTEGAQAAEKPK